MRITNTRLVHLLVLAAASLIIGVICFFLGGEAAEASGVAPALGFTFRAGGALAGFLISFSVLFFAYGKIGVSSFSIRVLVTPGPRSKQFKRKGNTFEAKYTVLKSASGNKKEFDCETAWEAAGLTLHLRDVEDGDMVMVVVKDSTGGKWESNYFSPLNQFITLE